MEFKDPPLSGPPLVFASEGLEFWRVYYQPVRDRVQQAQEEGVAGEMFLENGVQYWVAFDPVGDVTVGLPALLMEEDAGPFEEIRILCEDILPGLTETESPADLERVIFNRTVTDRNGTSWSIGSDGVVVALGPRWQPSQMQLNPQRRRDQ